ncbi:MULTISPECIES: hypothetical protein [unclassified Nocardioides]|uniref:hypothetical protein n=1 Tax=unclassified Nocardioides TaxID=2615069 RepID=UPI000303C8C7|nr:MULTISPECIES: hypothetical protein [unclassified Nocardioides]
MDQQHRQADGLLARIARGLPPGDPESDAAYGALLGTGMTPAAIVAVLRELARVRPLARTA